jgi:hypothetical protein
MWCGIGVIVLTGLFPFVKKPNRRLEIGYLLDDYKYLQIDVVLIIWALAAVVTIGLIVSLKDKTKDRHIDVKDNE